MKNNLEEEWKKKLWQEFDEKFEHSETCVAINWDDKGNECMCENKELKQFISSLLKKEKRELLKQILAEASGGGSWRRVINQKLSDLTGK